MYLLSGTELNNRYKIETVLGHGGFGITYSALDKILNVKVAIKEYLSRQSATRAEGQTKVSVFTGEARKHYNYGLKKFLEEAQSIAQFSHHPNIVSARDYFETNNTAYMVMEYIEGVTLKEYLEQKGGRIPFEEAKAIMMPVMDALREIHLAGLLHRDISPDNIYITTTGQVKLLDFGAARYYAGEQSKSLSVILKPGYAPEEQYRSSGKQGTWTDVYATGATLYRVISGKTLPDALDRKEEDTLEPPSQLGISIPADAEKALLKALAVSAAHRFQTMGEFQEALNNGIPIPEPITRATIVEPFRERPADLPREPLSKKPKSKTVILIFGGVVGIALLGSILGTIISQPPNKKFIVKPEPVVKSSGQVPSATTDGETRPKDLLEQGRSHIKDKNYEKAIAVLERAVIIEPINAMAHYELGIAYAGRGYEKKAMKEHEIIEKLDKELANKLLASMPKKEKEKAASPSVPAEIQIDYLKLLKAQVKSIKLFESGNEGTPLQKRVYSNRFRNSGTRFVNIEITLLYPRPNRPIDFSIKALWLRGDGSLIREQYYQYKVEPNWSGSKHSSGLGSDKDGDYWPIGNYRVDLFSGERKIGSQAFQVAER